MTQASGTSRTATSSAVPAASSRFSTCLESRVAVPARGCSTGCRSGSAARSRWIFWQRRLAGADVASKRLPEGLLFSDPDGLELELVVDDGEDEPLTATASDIDPSLAIRGIDSVRAYKGESAEPSQDLVDVLGMTVDEERGLLTRGDHRHGWVIFDNVPDGSGAIGAGSFHHAAFTIADGDAEEWRERLAAV